MTGHSALLQRYKAMGTEELVRLAADGEKLTPEAGEALRHELKERHLDGPSAIREYERERDVQVRQAEDAAAARRWSNRLGINRVIEPLRRRPFLAALVSVCCPVAAYLFFYVMTKLSIGGFPAVTFLVFGIAAFGAKCGVIAARSRAAFLIRSLGLLGAIVGIPLAFIFLVYAVLGVG